MLIISVTISQNHYLYVVVRLSMSLKGILETIEAKYVVFLIPLDPPCNISMISVPISQAALFPFFVLTWFPLRSFIPYQQDSFH